MNLSQLLEPWAPVTGSGRELVNELLTEMSPGHVLFGRPVEAVARRRDRDDVLFRVESTFAVVHLAYSGREKRLEFPSTELYDSWADFVEQRVVTDSLEYKS